MSRLRFSALMIGWAVACLAAVNLAFAAPLGPSSIGSSPSQPSPAIFRPGIVPSVHLAKLEATSTPTVCFIGDSTISQASYIAAIDSQLSKIETALRSKYPTKTFTFKDFSVGGTSLNQFTTALSANWPAWYTNHASTWNSYVAAAGCTSLIISFGVNSPGNDVAGTWNPVLTAIVAYSTIPDIIISTPISVNPAASGQTAAYQAGYLANAASGRSIALSGNSLGVSSLPQIGLLDIGRFFQMAVFGRDPVQQILSYNIQSSAPVTAGTTTTATFNYSLPAPTDGDFDLQFTVTNWTSDSSYMDVGVFDSTGLSGTGLATGYVLCETTNGTTSYTNFYYANGAANISSNHNAWNNSGTETFEVSVQDMHLQVYVNGTLQIDQDVPIGKAPFTPWITLYSPTNGMVVTINQYATGKMRAYAPIIPQAVVYGGNVGNDGNAVNHLSSDGLNAIYAPVIEAAFGTSAP
jgi:hypothetical protein